MSDERNGSGANPWMHARKVPGTGWWLGQILLTGIACFFVWFGISLLVAAYGLNDPFSFIMTFFAACLVVLISAVMVAGFVLRMRFAARLRKLGHGSGEER